MWRRAVQVGMWREARENRFVTSDYAGRFLASEVGVLCVNGKKFFKHSPFISKTWAQNNI